MATYTKQKLSGSTNGRQIKVVSTSGSAGTAIHTSVSGTTDFDEIWLYAVNSSAATAKLTIEWGDTTDPDDLIEGNIPAEQGYVLIIPGLLLQNGTVVNAFSSASSVILVNGFVNRITA